MLRRLGSVGTVLLGFVFACGGTIASGTDAGPGSSSSSGGGSGSSSGISGSSSGISGSSSGTSGGSSGVSSSSSSGVAYSCSAYAGPSSCGPGSLTCDMTTCCPQGLPFACPGTGQCFGTQSQAVAACPYTCEYCTDTTPVVDAGPPDVAQCANGTIAVVGVDGGENVACEQQIALNCGIQQCECTGDPSMLVTDAGTYPGCGVFVLCTYAELAQLLATSDAGAAPDLQQAMNDCAVTTGASASSVMLGQQFYMCLAASGPTVAACLPQ